MENELRNSQLRLSEKYDLLEKEQANYCDDEIGFNMCQSTMNCLNCANDDLRRLAENCYISEGEITFLKSILETFENERTRIKASYAIYGDSPDYDKTINHCLRDLEEESNNIRYVIENGGWC